MFEPHFGQCIDCTPGKRSLIVVKAGRCKYHNELHKGNDVSKMQIARAAVNPVSEKQKQSNAAKARVYQKFDALMRDQEKVYCSGCGTTERLSHSHLVPISRNKKLEAALHNIRYHCMSGNGVVGCHDKWETHDIRQMKQLADFDENMERICEMDPEYFELLLQKDGWNS